jgi:hypothetical protein
MKAPIWRRASSMFGVGSGVDLLLFERLHEAFRLGVVVRVGGPAHADGDLARIEPRKIGDRGVLHAAVGVVDEAHGAGVAEEPRPPASSPPSSALSPKSHWRDRGTGAIFAKTVWRLAMAKVLHLGKKASRTGKYELRSPPGAGAGKESSSTRGKPLPPTPKPEPGLRIIESKSGRHIIASPAKSSTTIDSWARAFNKA